MTKKKQAQAIRDYLAARDQGKECYARSDVLLEELRASLTPGEPVDLGDGRTATLVDQFATKMKVWKPCGINRWDVKVVNG